MASKNKTEIPKLECVACKKLAAEVIYTTKVFGQGEDALIVENVPLIRCRNCGESYYTWETAKRLDEIRLHRNVPLVKVEHNVAQFV